MSGTGGGRALQAPADAEGRVRHHRPTQEQRAIVEADGRVVTINARAGTGKTTTLRMIAERFRDARGLYLVFNKRAQLRAQAVFPPHVDVRTVHSLAFGSARHDQRWRLGPEVGPAAFLPTYADVPEVQHDLAGLSHSFLAYFLGAPYPRVEQALQPFSERCLSDAQHAVFNRYEEQIAHACRGLLTAWYQGTLACPHDFYLKLAHRTGSLQRRLAGYELVLVDEGQDLSEIMLDLLKHCSGRVVLVGDTHQGIYGFRFAVDATQRLAADATHELTTSFRFGRGLAELASLYIQESKGLKDFRIRGSKERNTKTHLYRDLRPRTVPIGGAVLARTNLSLFEAALRLQREGRPLRFEREVSPLMGRVRDVLRLSKGRGGAVGDPFIASFGSLSHLEAYADRMRDGYLLSLVSIVKRHGDGLEDRLHKLRDHFEKSAELPRHRVVTLSTVHAAKGEEYPTVTLHEDIPARLEQTLADETATRDAVEEINVAYVAFTRAQRELQIPEAFSDLLSTRWQRHLRTLASRPGKSCQKPARALRIGDRVQTRNGAGVIRNISADGRQLQVALEGQDLVLTERRDELCHAPGAAPDDAP